jgi:hypothetical protein
MEWPLRRLQLPEAEQGHGAASVFSCLCDILWMMGGVRCFSKTSPPSPFLGYITKSNASHQSCLILCYFFPSPYSSSLFSFHQQWEAFIKQIKKSWGKQKQNKTLGLSCMVWALALLPFLQHELSLVPWLWEHWNGVREEQQGTGAGKDQHISLVAEPKPRQPGPKAPSIPFFILPLHSSNILKELVWRLLVDFGRSTPMGGSGLLLEDLYKRICHRFLGQ